MKLTRYQLEDLLQNVRLDYKGTNLYAICPFCNEDEFGISLDDNHVYNCFRAKNCGAKGNIFSLLKHLGRTKEFLTEKEIETHEKLESNFVKTSTHLDLEMPEVEPPLLWRRLSSDPYLENRGMTEEQFSKFEVGRSKLNKDYITFLVRREGKLVGYVSRSVKSKVWIDAYNQEQKVLNSKIVYLRYNNSKTDFAKTLFGYDEIIEGVTTDVILVEGLFSKTKTDENLMLDYFEEMKCCATFGAKLSAHQIELLKRKKVKTLWFWFESDVLEKIKSIVTEASVYFDVKVCYLDKKDPNDIGRVEAIELLDNAKNFLDFNTSYLSSSL